MKQLQPVKDHRSGYQRQEDEPVHIKCECGAKIFKREDELIHVGLCKKLIRNML